MTKPINNYLKVLSYLKQYEGDEEYHEVENVLTGMDESIKLKVFRELKKEGFIRLIGGPAPIYSFGKTTRDGYGSRSTVWHQVKGGDTTPFKGKITFKGSTYLKEELQMSNSKVNINVGDNSTANMILHSPGATINNKPQIIEKVESIKEALANDMSIDDATRSNAVTILNNLVSEVNTSGAPSQSTFSNVLSIGSNISSIASLAISLCQLFVHP